MREPAEPSGSVPGSAIGGTHASALAGVGGGALEFGSAGGTFAQRSGVKPGGKRGPVPEPASGAGDDLGRWHEADGAPSEDSWLGDSCEPGGSAHTEHPGGEPGPARERPVRPGVPPDQVCADAKLRPRWSSQGSPRGGPSPIAQPSPATGGSWERPVGSVVLLTIW